MATMGKSTRRPILFALSILFTIGFILYASEDGRGDECQDNHGRATATCGDTCGGEESWTLCDGLNCSGSSEAELCRSIEHTVCPGCPGEATVPMFDLVGICFCGS
jgi:hypothetical protein